MISREEELKKEIAALDAVTAEVNAIAGDLSKDEISPSQEKAREEVIGLLGTNYVGPDLLGRELYGLESKFSIHCSPAAPTERKPPLFQKIFGSTESKQRSPKEGPEKKLDFVKLKMILNEPDEWESEKKRYETYALTYVPSISFKELLTQANAASEYKGVHAVIQAHAIHDLNGAGDRVLCEGNWELVRRSMVPKSIAKSMDDQLELIREYPYLRVATFPGVTSMAVGQYLGYGIRFNEGSESYMRTSTSAGASTNRHLCVGRLSERGFKGFDVFAWPLDETNAGLGVSHSLEECYRS